MNTKRIKAQNSSRFNPQPKDASRSYAWIPTWELPRTPEAYDAIVESMAKAIYATMCRVPVSSVVRLPERGNYTKEARAALRAIGITRPRK